jgi:hypothetical protein
VQAILVYPMNALINSQAEELKKLADAYEAETGSPFPLRYAAYTGQTKSEVRKQILDNPPDILLTNYMMLELLLTRHGEQQIRDSIYASLQFLVFDELHTYRGRQGADVGMLIRRIRGCCKSPVTTIGTSATMVTSGSYHDQRLAVAAVAEQIFGDPFTPDQVIGETLARSLPGSENPPVKSDLSETVRTLAPSSAGVETLRNFPTALWLEGRIALSVDHEAGGRLKRGTPLQMAEIAKLLATDSGEPAKACAEHLESLLLWISEINLGLVKSGERYTILPFRLHQFFAQTGSVYATLGLLGERFITLEPGVHHSDQAGERFIFPHVFSRASGKTFIGVFQDTKKGVLLPRDFTNQESTSEENVAGYIIPGDLDIWNPEEDLENLPPAWIQNLEAGKVKKDYADRMPVRISYDAEGNVLPPAIPSLPSARKLSVASLIRRFMALGRSSAAGLPDPST